MSTWKEVRQQLRITEDDEKIIAMEKELIRTLVSIREEQGISQTVLAEKCNTPQPAIARLEKNVHSPRIDSILRVLTPMGYTLKIVPIENKKN
ncbi:MAG: XRE family transcriptional regulator [Lachnospiraceae bacterium]|nr:XRE family transcriptional regulator [Lachnospiraceae bacterium]